MEKNPCNQIALGLNCNANLKHRPSHHVPPDTHTGNIVTNNRIFPLKNLKNTLSSYTTDLLSNNYKFNLEQKNIDKIELDIKLFDMYKSICLLLGIYIPNVHIE